MIKIKTKKQITVLLADDHAVVREGLRVLLEQSADIRVVAEAANGREAVQLAHELKPNIVLMDITMRELNGVDATRLVCEKCPATRVVMLSMHSNSEHVFRALEACSTGFVLKEAAGEEVAMAVRAVHAGQSYFSSALADLGSAMQSRPGRVSPLDLLSKRERHVLQLVAEGRTSAEIAVTMNLSPKTIETYRGRLMKKLSVRNVAYLVKFAIEHDLIPTG